MSLLARLIAQANVHREDIAIRFDDRELSYGDLVERIENTIAKLRALGVGPGERFAYLGWNDPEVLVLLFALSALRAIFLPLNYRLVCAEHARILTDSGARWLLSSPAFFDHLKPLWQARGSGPQLLAMTDTDHADPLPAPAIDWHSLDESSASLRALPAATGDDAVLLAYTSGATGVPKGAVLTQGNLIANAEASQAAHEMTSRDHVLSNLPLFHVGGLNIQTLPALLTGATVTLQRRFNAEEALIFIGESRPTLALFVPTTLRALLEHPRFAETDLSSLRLVMTGSSNTPDALIHAMHARGVAVGQVYGATETAPVAICLTQADAREHVGWAGKGAASTEIRLVRDDGVDASIGEPGEIWVRGPQVMREYWCDPTLTVETLINGWFHTGDIGEKDSEGFIRIRGRSKDLIISGGENIYPAELENILALAPSIAEAAVIGVAHPRWGETPVACIVRRSGAVLDEAEVLALFEGRLARYKWPHRIIFLDALPKNAMGKVVKGELRQTVGNRL